MNKKLISLFEILDRKNSYLLEFHKINMDELKRLAEGHTDNLENFYYSRELLLNAIYKLDDQISKDYETKALRVSARDKKKLINTLNFKKKMVMSILDQDLTIMSLVDQMKKESIKPIAS